MWVEVSIRTAFKNDLIQFWKFALDSIEKDWDNDIEKIANNYIDRD